MTYNMWYQRFPMFMAAIPGMIIAVLMLKGGVLAEKFEAYNTVTLEGWVQDISADGKVALVVSNHMYYNDGDNTNDFLQAYLLNIQTKELALISKSKHGEEANKGIHHGGSVMSPDGNFVFYYSDSTNIIDNQADTLSHHYLYDRRNDTTILIPFDRRAFEFDISNEASFIVYKLGIALADPQIFLYDRSNDTTIQISKGWWNINNIITPDGRYVVYNTNLVSGGLGIARYDTQTKETLLISLTASNDEPLNYSHLYVSDISPDGKSIIFTTEAKMTTDDTNNHSDIYIYEIDNSYLRLISVSTSGQSSDNNSGMGKISSDKRFIIYQSLATNLDDSIKTRGGENIFAHDLVNRTTTLISKSYIGEPATGDSGRIRGNHIFFDSFAINIVPNDIKDELIGTYVYNMETQTNQFVFSPGGGPSESEKSVVIFIPGIGGSQLIRNVNNGFDEYLWPVYPDEPKKKMSLKPGKRDDSIYTDDVIREYIPGYLRPFTKYIYGPFLNALVSQGYKEYQTSGHPEKRRLSGCDTSQKEATLFVFPWDWRFGAVDAIDPQISLSPNNVALLREYIECILLIHPEAEIALVSHSMGWFVGRTYVLQYPNNHHITQHIAIVPPRLGAPKTIAMMLTGDWLPKLISKDVTRSLLEYLPGGHQLLPSELYWQMFGSPFYLNSWQMSGDVTFEKFQQTLQAYYTSPDESDFYRSIVPFVDNMKEVYKNPAFVDLRGDRSGVNYHIIYGVQDFHGTIGKIKEKPLLSYSLVTNPDQLYDYILTSGDGTVPELSASAKSSGLDLNGTARLHKLTGDAMEHQGIMSEKKLQSCVFALLENSVCTEVVAASTGASNSRYIKLWGVETVQVTDGISTTENIMTTTLSLNLFPDISAGYLGDHSIMLIITGEKSYTVTFSAHGTYFEAESQYGTGESSLHTVRFTPQPATNQLMALVTTQDDTLTVMKADTNSDGTVDLVIPSVADLTQSQANDRQRPTVSAMYDLMQGLVITTTDDLSGVSQVWYTTDAQQYHKYTEPVVFTDVNITNVTVVAQDKAGNISLPITVEVNLVAQSKNFIFLPLINR